MIKTPDVVNLDKSHVSFCRKAFRFRQEIERSLHETKSEISWNREAWVHETKSEFVGERGKRAHEIMSELVEKMEEMPHETESEFGESGGEALHETESEFVESRGKALHEIKSDFTGAITADRGRGGGGLFFPVRRKALRAEDDHLPQIEIVAMVGAFCRLLDMVHEFSMLRPRSVWRQKRSRSMPTDVCSVCPRILARRSAHWSAGAKNSFMSFARRAACSAEICAKAALPLSPRSMRCGTTFSF